MGTPHKNISVTDESSVTLSPSEVDLDAADVDVSILRSGAKWVRSHNISTESRKRSSDDEYEEPQEKKKFRSSFSPGPEVQRVPRLDKEFRKPPPPHQHKRRMPSRGHLRTMATMEPGTGSSDDALEVLGSPTYHPKSAAPPPASETEMDTDTPVPSAPPLSPHIYPSLPPPSHSSTDTATERESVAGSEVEGTATSRPIPSPSAFSRTSEINMQRRHTFFTKTLMRIETCQVCNKKIRFGKNCLKCRDCRSLCHPECKSKVPLPCIPSVPTPKKVQDAGLASFCPNTIPRVPALLIHCVTEIERRGLTDVGLYRVPGSDKVKKEVKERLLRVRGQPALDKVSDVNVLCSVLKDFLSSLREPILTFRLHKTFLDALDAGSDEDTLALLLKAIAELPPCNKDTLAFTILHLQKVASFSDANKMPMESLAKIFGPTLVGHGSSRPDPSVQWKDAEKQPKIVLRLLNISPDYWRQYLSPMENPEPVTSPNVGSAQSSPGFNSPSTPEQRPVPESPFLGSCQSPRSNVFGGRGGTSRAGVPSTPSFSTRRNGNFFPSLN